MDFRKELKQIVEGVRGGLAGMIVGTDGIPVESYIKEGFEVDIEEIGAELSALLQQLMVMVKTTGVGSVENFWIVTKNYKMLVAPLTEEYFVLIMLERSAFIGQGLFRLRVHADAIKADLV